MPSATDKPIYNGDAVIEKVALMNNLVALCTASKLILGKIFDSKSFKVEKEFNLASAVLSITITLSGLVATTLIDGSLILFEHGKEFLLIKPSRNLLNDVDVQDRLVATTGDDKLLSLFNLDEKTSEQIALKSRGVSCKFNKRYVSHLLVGETSRIFLYDLNSKATIFTIPVNDLVALDWNSDPAIFGGLGMDGRWWLWSMERNPFNIPQHQGQAVPGAKKFKFIDKEGTFFCIGSFHGDTAISVYPNGYTKGIPFVVMIAAWHFGIGLASALFTRNIVPTITKWRRKLKEIQRTGTWRSDDPPSPDPNVSQHRGLNEQLRQSPLNSPVLSNSTATDGKQSVFGVNPITEFVSRLIQWIYPISTPGYVDETISMFALETVNEYEQELTPQEQFLQDLANAASNTAGRQPIIEDRMDHRRPRTPSLIFEDARSMQAESMAGFFSELASVASPEKVYSQKIQYKTTQQTPSLYSVPSVYRSVLDELADASELLENEILSKSKPANMDKKPTILGKSKISISPDDSASQDGSDGLAISEINMNDNGDTTDAAKLLFMFGMERSSPQRPPIFPRNSSPERYFVPGLVDYF